MVENFEHYTEPLNDDDQKAMAVFLIGINLRGKDNPIKAAEILSAINAKVPENGISKKLTGARLRKVVNYIRVNSIAPVIATSNGYFVSDDPEIIRSQIRSLFDRAEGIRAAAEGLDTFLNDMINRKKKEREESQRPMTLFQ